MFTVTILRAGWVDCPEKSSPFSHHLVGFTWLPGCFLGHRGDAGGLGPCGGPAMARAETAAFLHGSCPTSHCQGIVFSAFWRLPCAMSSKGKSREPISQGGTWTLMRGEIKPWHQVTVRGPHFSSGNIHRQRIQKNLKTRQVHFLDLFENSLSHFHFQPLNHVEWILCVVYRKWREVWQATEVHILRSLSFID